MHTSTGQLLTIDTPANKVRDLRNAALNIMERIKDTNEVYASLMVQLNSQNLNIERMVNESQFTHLARLTSHLAVIEGEQLKSEVLSATRKQTDDLSKPHNAAPDAKLPVHRQSTKFGRFLQHIADKVG